MSTAERLTLFADVMIPVPVPGLFTYRVPYELNNKICEGLRVIVQFGKKKIYAGLVVKIHQKVPLDYTPKYILDLLDQKAVVNAKQFAFWDWIHHYYMCHTGEVMSAALPSALKLSSESKIVLNEDFVQDAGQLNDSEFLITEALSIQPKLSISEVTKIVGFQKVMPLLKTMIEKHIILMEEELEEKFKAKKERFIKISEEYKDEVKLSELMDRLGKKSYKQLELLMVYLMESRFPVSEAKDIAAATLIERSKSSAAQLKSLIDKGVFTESQKVVSRLEQYVASSNPDNIVFTAHQQIAIDKINALFAQKDVVLLHGVTSSGKTELYIKLISDAIKDGKQVLYLLPEIALTTQIIQRLKTYFGNKVGVYHSRYNDYERVEVWNKVLDYKGESEHQIIIGPRSAIFLPFSNLGLIIVDEEHDSSYKQYEPAPRYQARDAAIMLGGIFSAKILLGSATPSFESYYNVKTGKFGLVELLERYGGMQLPEIEVVNLREETRRKTMKSHFSSVLMQEIKQAVEKKEQVILFQNRRGFSLRLECDDCSWIPECRNCDVSLIYHKKQNMMRCHYCGYAIAVPSECPSCHSNAVRMHGFGTEKVEEELGLLLPGIRIARLDLDTTRSKFAFQQILETFGAGKTDVLVGTQMVTKGLDFDRVSIVGILNADNMLSYPDFRAFERSYQLMAQVSGRAGRKHKRGKVIVQTYQPNHDLLKHVLKNSYEDLFEQQMKIRHQFRYPPFYRLIMIRLMHRESHALNIAAFDLAKMLKDDHKFDILGPEYPIVTRIKNLYIKQIIVKFSRSVSTKSVKDLLSEKISLFQSVQQNKSVRLQIDVDPQ
ncbi:MAG: primosomal protein N' [Bacteroidales bacterium]|nr:primosomal protein N' [Bacteroidales bacterium]